MEQVWVVETGDYSQRHIFCIATSLAAAVEHVRSTFEQPYDVQWADLRDTSYGDDERYEEWALVGAFAAVPGYSTKHTATFDISPYDVVAV